MEIGNSRTCGIKPLAGFCVKVSCGSLLFQVVWETTMDVRCSALLDPWSEVCRPEGEREKERRLEREVARDVSLGHDGGLSVAESASFHVTTLLHWRPWMCPAANALGFRWAHHLGGFPFLRRRSMCSVTGRAIAFGSVIMCAGFLFPTR